jgi:dihydroxyacetone kinase-like predicted kinase
MKKTTLLTVAILALTSILIFQKNKKGKNKFLEKVKESAKYAVEDTLDKLSKGTINPETAKTI